MNEELWTSVDHYISHLLLKSDGPMDEILKSNTAAGLPAIDVSAPQGKLLYLFAKMISAKKILEVGTLGGYSTIWLAKALPENGKVISLEISSKHAEVARENAAKAGFKKIIDIRVGPALETLKKIDEANEGPFDLTFIDADKANNPEYFKAALKMSKVGSLIICDNVIRDGKIVDMNNTDPGVLGTRRLYEIMSSEPRVTTTAIQTVGTKGHDGFAIALVVK